LARHDRCLFDYLLETSKRILPIPFLGSIALSLDDDDAPARDPLIAATQ
jgi:hypothetical protein